MKTNIHKKLNELESPAICGNGISPIKKLSQKWNIPVNFMFIGSPSDKFTYSVEELGGVRLII